MSDTMEMRRVGQRVHRFGPKSPDHPTVGHHCTLCDVPFEAGEYTTLIATEPADEEEREKMEAGRPYNAAAVEVHWTCASRLPVEHPYGADY